MGGQGSAALINRTTRLPGWENIPPGIRISMIHNTINKQRENAGKLIKALYKDEVLIPGQQKRIERIDKVPVH